MSIVPMGRKRVPAGLLAIFLGGLGIHKFYLGYWKEGLIVLLLSLVGGWVSFGVIPALVWLFGIFEGFLYLRQSDYGFGMRQESGRRPWL